MYVIKFSNMFILLDSMTYSLQHRFPLTAKPLKSSSIYPTSNG